MNEKSSQNSIFHAVKFHFRIKNPAGQARYRNLADSEDAHTSRDSTQTGAISSGCPPSFPAPNCS